MVEPILDQLHPLMEDLATQLIGKKMQDLGDSFQDSFLRMKLSFHAHRLLLQRKGVDCSRWAKWDDKQYQNILAGFSKGILGQQQNLGSAR